MLRAIRLDKNLKSNQAHVTRLNTHVVSRPNIISSFSSSELPNCVSVRPRPRDPYQANSDIRIADDLRAATTITRMGGCARWSCGCVIDVTRDGINTQPGAALILHTYDRNDHIPTAHTMSPTQLAAPTAPRDTRVELTYPPPAHTGSAKVTEQPAPVPTMGLGALRTTDEGRSERLRGGCIPCPDGGCCFIIPLPCCC
ncbi:unnamed protein product [Mycena citricolor]|uniref:Uncharacterized protein n=1 Tax=Mycena citricolor TaxID=2018698 RepID=A0AAD2H284_9AGAR|nr:unnamed protein product [Mycena citricolor]